MILQCTRIELLDRIRHLEMKPLLSRCGGFLQNHLPYQLMQRSKIVPREIPALNPVCLSFPLSRDCRAKPPLLPPRIVPADRTRKIFRSSQRRAELCESRAPGEKAGGPADAGLRQAR